MHVRKEAEPDGSGLTVDFHRSPQRTATLHQNRLPRQRYRDNATQTGASISACEMKEKRQERRDIILILCEPQPCLQTTTGTTAYLQQLTLVAQVGSGRGSENHRFLIKILRKSIDFELQDGIGGRLRGRFWGPRGGKKAIEKLGSGQNCARTVGTICHCVFLIACVSMY